MDHSTFAGVGGGWVEDRVLALGCCRKFCFKLYQPPPPRKSKPLRQKFMSIKNIRELTALVSIATYTVIYLLNLSNTEIILNPRGLHGFNHYYICWKPEVAVVMVREFIF